MLKQCEMSFGVEDYKPSLEEASAAVARLASEGYLARERFAAFGDPQASRISMVALMTGEDAIDASMRDPAVREVWATLRRLASTEIRISYMDCAGTEEVSYLEHADAPLVLQPDYHFGLPPLARERDGAVLGLYKILMEVQISQKLDTWDTAYRMMYGLWLASSGYDDWVRREFVDPESWLNRTGTELSAALTQIVGQPVAYTRTSRDEMD